MFAKIDGELIQTVVVRDLSDLEGLLSLSAYADLKKYLEMTEEQKASVEGQTLLRNLNIQLSVSGINDLEDANKVLEGTTQLITDLQKGGNIALKAKISF